MILYRSAPARLVAVALVVPSKRLGLVALGPRDVVDRVQRAHPVVGILGDTEDDEGVLLGMIGAFVAGLGLTLWGSAGVLASL